MKHRQLIRRILLATSEGIPGHKTETVIKNALLSAYDSGALAMGQAVKGHIDEAILGLRASANDDVWGERPSWERISVQIRELDDLRDSLARIFANTAKMNSPRLCRDCGESLSMDAMQQGDSSCPGCATVGART